MPPSAVGSRLFFCATIQPQNFQDKPFRVGSVITPLRTHQPNLTPPYNQSVPTTHGLFALNALQLPKR